MTVFELLEEEYISWCRRERQGLQCQQAVFSNGARMRRDRRDITDEVLLGLEADIAGLDDLIAECEAHAP
jgi:hypothetical protein